MNERMQRILADLKARQDAGEHMACLRCGCDTMKPAVYTNALSRQADIAVGFMSEKANHKYRYVWLYKVRAKPVTENYSTKAGQT